MKKYRLRFGYDIVPGIVTECDDPLHQKDDRRGVKTDGEENF